MENKALLIIALGCCGALAVGLVFWSQIPVTPPTHQDAPSTSYMVKTKPGCLGDRCVVPRASYEPPATCWVSRNTLLVCPCPKGAHCLRLSKMKPKRRPSPKTPVSTGVSRE